MPKEPCTKWQAVAQATDSNNSSWCLRTVLMASVILVQDRGSLSIGMMRQSNHATVHSALTRMRGMRMPQPSSWSSTVSAWMIQSHPVQQQHMQNEKTRTPEKADSALTRMRGMQLPQPSSWSSTVSAWMIQSHPEVAQVLSRSS